MSKKEKKNSEKKIKEGILISINKAKQHLDAAELLINGNFLDDAIAAIEFAIEEFGRAVYLKERLDKGLETIEGALDKNHWLKYDKAFSYYMKS
jgi:exonuclease VII small subunit